MGESQKRKVVLILLYENYTDIVPEEVGICIIAGLLRKNGYEVLLISKDIEILDNKMLIEYQPDLIGYTVYQFNKNTVHNHIKKIKVLLPNTYISIGGIYATYSCQEMMEENKIIDFCIRGEGEQTFLELMNEISKKSNAYQTIDGLTYRMGEQIINNKDRILKDNLDSLPFAARDFIEQRPMTIASIVGSRGCCANCSFCTSKIQWKNWRGRSIDNIIDEIEYLINDYHVKSFNFYDNSFEDPYINLDRLKEFTQKVIERNIKMYYNVYVRADFYKKATDEIMKLLVKSGFRSVEIGIESANEHDLKLYNKIANPVDNVEIIEFMKKYEILYHIDFINFNPYSTYENINTNLEYLYQYKSLFNFFSVLNIFNGTKIYEKVVSDGLFIQKDKNGNNQYSFVEPSIGNICRFLSDYKRYLIEEKNNAFNDIKWLLVFIELQLSYIKNQATELKKNVYERCMRYFDVYYEIQNKVNNLFYNWIKRIIELGKCNKSYEEFEKYTRENNITSKLFELFDGLKKLNEDVSKFNVYCSLLIN